MHFATFEGPAWMEEMHRKATETFDKIATTTREKAAKTNTGCSEKKKAATFNR